MIYRKKGTVTFYSNAHPAGLGCEGHPQCDCKYHVVDDQEIYSFDDFQEADEKYQQLTGDERLDNILIKHSV